MGISGWVGGQHTKTHEEPRDPGCREIFHPGQVRERYPKETDGSSQIKNGTTADIEEIK